MKSWLLFWTFPLSCGLSTTASLAPCNLLYGQFRDAAKIGYGKQEKEKEQGIKRYADITYTPRKSIKQDSTLISTIHPLIGSRFETPPILYGTP